MWMKKSKIYRQQQFIKDFNLFYLYCLKCKEKTVSKNSEVIRTKRGRIMFSSKYVVYDWEKFSEQKVSEIYIVLKVWNQQNCKQEIKNKKLRQKSKEKIYSRCIYQKK